MIDGTPDAIFTLLTEVKCPLPPTHTAAFVAAGYSLKIDKEGLEAAKKWLREIEDGIKQNYEDIDSIVRRYWMANTDKAVLKPEHKPERNLNGYDSSYIPSEQGLPDAESELIRTGLIEKPIDNEIEKHPENAWLFDVDGVITNPSEKRITEPEILDEILKRLNRGEPIGLNTGRSIDFVIDQVLKPLEDRIDDKRILDNIIAIGEKGGVWITYVNGERIEEIDEEIKVPEILADKIRELIESEFSETMFFDETKKTMISTEMKKGMDLDAYREEQRILVEKFSQILEEMNLSGLKIDPTTIATDLQNGHVGKALGSKKFLEILKARGVSPASFTAFGDSKSDFEMIDPFKYSGIPMNFVFVGTGDGKVGEDFTTTKEHFDKGTLEYLKAN